MNITTGDWNCHNCGWKGNVRAFERKREDKHYQKPPQDVLKNIEVKQKRLNGLVDVVYRKKRLINL